MRRALLTALVTSAACPAAAAADTVAHRTPVVGPKIAGPATVWGEERGAGLRIVIGAGSARPGVLYRLAPSGAAKTTRDFFSTPWSLSASPTHVAAVVLTNTITSERGDSVTTASTTAAVGGPLAGVRTLSGRTPRRGDSRCRTPYTSPEAVAVDGATIAVAERFGECGSDELPGYRIVVRDGDAVQTMPVAAETYRLRIAGPYVAWVESAGPLETVVVFDRATGMEVARERRFAIGDLDLTADGTVALTYADGPRERRLGVLRAGTPGLRTLARDVADRGVALAAGRVLYERYDRGDFHSRLLLRDLAGGTRRLATFTPRRRRVGDLDLSPRRAVWAAQKTRSADYEAKPSGPARIVSRRL